MIPYHETSTGLLVPPSRNGHASHAMTEVRHAAEMALAEATIADLRFQLNENEWLRLGEDSGYEFGRDDIGKIVASARAYYLKNPIVNRAVEIGALYVWGQELSVTAMHKQVEDFVDAFWTINQSTLTGQSASRLLEVELECTGNVFLALFANSETGETRVRLVPFEQMQTIVTNPEDRAEVWYYRRSWSQRRDDGTGDEQKTAFYPNWKYVPKNKPTELSWNGQTVPVIWDAPVMHVKTGAFLHWLWGVPEVYAALDWARAYKSTLEDDVKRSAALAKFAYKLTTSGGAQGVAAAQARIASTLGTNNRGETNPASATGSVYIRGSQEQDLEAVDISRAMMPVDHSRPIRLMAAAALGLPETFFGDANVGNHATAKTLDRPTELRYNERRGLWRDVFTELIQWVIDRDLMARRGRLPKTLTDEQREVDLSFPDLLEADVTARVAAVVAAVTLDGKTPAGTISEETTSRELMSALAIDDIDGEIEKLNAEKLDREQKAAQMARQMQPTGPTGPTSPTGPTGTTGATATEARKDPPIWDDEADVTDDDLKDAADYFNSIIPQAAGLLDAQVEGSSDPDGDER